MWYDIMMVEQGECVKCGKVEYIVCLFRDAKLGDIMKCAESCECGSKKIKIV